MYVVMPLLLAASPIVALLVGSPAHANNGVLEINQTCAQQTGCFPNDAAGFPVTITQPGSYRLTSNLVHTTTPTAHVEILSSYVTFDLAGFEVKGPVSCIGTPPGCTGGPNGRGIQVDGEGRQHVVVRNGTVRGTSIYGVRVGERGRVDDIHVDDVGGIAVGTGPFSTVQRCTVVSSSGTAISMDEVGRAQDNVVMSTGGLGMILGSGSVVRGNAVSGASASGILCGTGCVVRDNAVSDSRDGITVSLGSSVIANAVTGNSIRGVSAGPGSFISSNTIRNNGGEAIHCTGSPPTARYSENVITSNNGTSDATDGNQGTPACLPLGLNHCGTDTTCP